MDQKEQQSRISQMMSGGSSSQWIKVPQKSNLKISITDVVNEDKVTKYKIKIEK